MIVLILKVVSILLFIALIIFDFIYNWKKHMTPSENQIEKYRKIVREYDHKKYEEDIDQLPLCTQTHNLVCSYVVGIYPTKCALKGKCWMDINGMPKEGDK